jgi:hypothetical protein
VRYVRTACTVIITEQVFFYFLFLFWRGVIHVPGYVCVVMQGSLGFVRAGVGVWERLRRCLTRSEDKDKEEGGGSLEVLCWTVRIALD